MAIILWNKKYTETLSETLKRFRQVYGEHDTKKVTYAGRLDPLAEGLLILLTNEDVHKKNDFLELPKTYEVDFILGVETDSYDILGRIQKIQNLFVDEEKIRIFLEEKKGSWMQKYPPYSSKTVSAKPLFEWARELRLDEIDIPQKKVEIFHSEYLGRREINVEELEVLILESIKKVKGDFRQEKIMNDWIHYFRHNNEKKKYIYTIRVSASSGTYMRSLVYDLGRSLGAGACSLKIKRLHIGDYAL